MIPGQHRKTARVLITDQQGRILLFLTHFDPEVGLPPRWITAGGGIDEGESELDAAIRELQEETGLSVSEADLTGPIWRTNGRWDWADGKNHHTFEDVIFELRDSSDSNFIINTDAWTDDERRDILEFRWWNVDDLIASGEAVSPPGLAEFVKRHRQG